MKFRKETDSMGTINVADDKYWGASTERSKKYFDIGKILVSKTLINAIAVIKLAAAKVHKNDKQIDTKNLSDFEKNIISIIEQYIQPAVAADGGSIVFKSFEEGVVYVILKGACSGCPSSTITLKQGIENLLKQKLGNDIKEVMAYNG